MNVAEKPLTDEEIEAYRKELADIKADRMRRELEEIKNERMRKELEEIKKERAAGEASPRRMAYAPAPAKPALSLSNLIASAVMLLIAGYLASAIYSIDLVGSINNILVSFSLPAMGTMIVAVLAVLLAVLGIALMTIARKL